MATYPEIWQVETGVVYGPNDNDFTGNLVLPTTAQVLNAVTYGGNSGLTGNFQFPVVGNVREGVTYGENGTGLTGTMNLPTPGNVRDGVGYGTNSTESTGTVVLPGIANVTAPVQYGAGGTEYTGVYTVVAASDVKGGVTFGANSSQTGTYNPSGNITLPAIAEVLDGVVYGDENSPLTGVYNEPDPTSYLVSASYGPNNSLSGFYYEVVASNVRSGITFGNNNTLTGTLAAGGTSSGGSVFMQGQLLGSVKVAGPTNVSLGNVSGLSAFNGSLIVGSSENGTSRFAIGATAANATYGNPIANGTSVEINAGPNAGASTSITLSVPTNAVLWLLCYKQPRIANEF